MVEKTESIFQKVFDYKWMLILFTIILIIMFYIRIEKNDNYDFVNSLLTEPEKVPLDLIKILIMYVLLMTVFTPFCRKIWSIIILLPFLSFLYTDDNYSNYKTEHELFEEAADEDNSVKYNIYLKHQKQKERNLTIRKLNLSLFILMLSNWNKLTQLTLNSQLSIAILFLLLTVTFLVGIKSQQKIDFTTGLKK